MWHWRSLSLKNRTGSDIFDSLFRQTNNICTLLESPYPSYHEQPQIARYSICAGSPRYVQGKQQLWTPPIGKILPFLRSLLQTKKNRKY